MKGTGAKRNVCPGGSCVSTGAKFPVAPVESAPMDTATYRLCQYTVWRQGLTSVNNFSIQLSTVANCPARRNRAVDRA